MVLYLYNYLFTKHTQLISAFKAYQHNTEIDKFFITQLNVNVLSFMADTAIELMK